MSSSDPARPRAGLSLYANLLNPNSSTSSSSGTISRAPVVFSQKAAQDSLQHDASAKKHLNPAALRFPPTKRPQLPAQKTKPKTSFSAIAASAPDSSSADSISRVAVSLAAPPVKTTIADWTADDDNINGFYAGEKRQRGGRKKRKKDKEEAVVVQNWDDIYDPSRPNNYEDYKHSDEQYREVREWKDRLYAHRMQKSRSRSQSSDGNNRGSTNFNSMPVSTSFLSASNPLLPDAFAPPINYSFAPPLSFQEKVPASGTMPTELPLPSPPTVMVPDDATGEDAYSRRLRLSHMPLSQPPTELMPPPMSPPPPPPADLAPLPPAQPAPGPTPTIVPKPPSATISRAPVRYQLPAAPVEIPASEAELEQAMREEAETTTEEPEDDAPRSLRPGQKGFAARLMSKYGWTKGSGLGASGTGIVNPLRVQVEKRKKKSDAEGGGFVGPAGKGKIVGGKKGGAPDEQLGRFGDMSEVVILKGMVDGMDLDSELGDGDLMQEIGEECSEKVNTRPLIVGSLPRNSTDGSVANAVRPSRESVYQPQQHSLGARLCQIYESAICAEAVNALEGRVFNGNVINAKFFDLEKFEMGTYE